MKSLYIIGLILALTTCSSAAFSQDQPPQSQNLPERRAPRQRPSEKMPENNTPALTERARIKNDQTSKAPTHVTWLREMYRTVDLTKDNNAALYYPVQPVGERMNLFTTIFKLLADKKITAYNYQPDKPEVFDDSEKVDFEDILKRFKILYQKQGSGDNVRFIVDDNDIPSYDVTQYRIKEGHYFDAATGAFKSQVTAICPILVQRDYFAGDTTLNAMFWIPYDTLRPYLSRTMIMTSDYNNVMTYSIDDFFTKGMYNGDIVKTVNLRDQSLAQQVGDDPEKLKLAQDSIEKQLKTFKKQLWIQPDTTQVAINKSGKKASVKKESVPKEEKPPKVKQGKSSSPTSSSPKRTVRKTR